MKKNYTKKAFLLNLLSFSIFIIFVILAVGSFSLSGGAHSRSPATYHTDGSVEITYHYHDGDQIWVYRRDDDGRAHGPAVITTNRSSDNEITEEKVTFVHGVRDGLATITEYGTSYYVCYDMGKRIDCPDQSLKNTRGTVSESSSYTLLEEKYPWYLFNFDTNIFSKEYIMNFLDEIQAGLNAVTFDVEDFDDVFDDVMSDLKDTPYDSIIARIDAFLEFYGIEEAKNSEFRLAVVENYRSSPGSTYTVVVDQFPNYLKHVNDAEISTLDFETFCDDFDTRMKAKPSLDVNDPAYLDSLDSRMFSVMTDIFSDAQETQLSLKSASLNLSSGKSTKERMQAYRKLFPQSVNGPEDVTLLVMYDVLALYYQAHIIKHVTKETYLTSKGISELPVVTTNLEGNSSASSNIVRGNVLEDGRSTVTDKGIVWASHYNPDTGDNVETAGSGIGEYSVTINGLSEGVTYYARAYAINSNGTSYGNCIPFTSASTTLPVNQHRTPASNITVYPNPAASISNLSFRLPSATTVMLHIYDVRGRMVYTMDLGSCEEGAHEISLDLSALKDGIYFSHLQVDGKLQATNKLVIQR